MVEVEIESHFDESGTHDGSPVLCLAGYIIDKQEMAGFDREWNEVLNWDQLPHSLPYFRMSQCAPEPPSGPFEGIPKPLRIQIVSRLMAVIKRRTIMGLAVTVNSEEFIRLMPHHPLIGTPYTFCSHVILAGVSSWIDSHVRQGGEVSRAAYFFESGHLSQPQADRIMTTLFHSPKAAKAHRYAGHAFVPKIGNPGVQAADLLAWQWYTDKRHELEGRVRRKDCASLLQHPHGVLHISSDKIVAMAEAFGFEKPADDTLIRLYFGEAATEQSS